MITTPTARAAYRLAKQVSREVPRHPVAVLKRATGTKRAVLILPPNCRLPDGWHVDLVVTTN